MHTCSVTFDQYVINMIMLMDEKQLPDNTILHILETFSQLYIFIDKEHNTRRICFITILLI